MVCKIWLNLLAGLQLSHCTYIYWQDLANQAVFVKFGKIFPLQIFFHVQYYEYDN